MLQTALIIAITLIVMPFILFALLPKREIDHSLLPTLDRESLLKAVQKEAREDALILKPHGIGIFPSLLKRTTEKAYRILLRKEKRGQKLSLHETIIVSDFYKISEKIEELRDVDLQALPHTAGTPRIVKLCSLIVKSLAGSITKKAIEECVEVYNDISPLSFPEIRALPLAINYALVELVTLVANRTINSNKRYEKGRADGRKNQVFCRNLKSNAYLLGAINTADEKTRKLIKAFCENNGINYSDRTLIESEKNSNYSAILSTTINSLFDINKWLTDDFVLNLSSTSKMLLEDDVYAQSTTKTKLSYLSFIYNKAKKKRLSEQAIATDLLSKAKANQKDLSFFVFPKECGKFLRFLYVFAQFLVVNAINLAIFFTFGLIESILAFPVLSVLVGEIFDCLLIKCTIFYSLPALKTNTGALIVSVRLITSKEEAEEAIFSIQTIATANNNKEHSFALLVDLVPSKNDTNKNDKIIIETLKEGFKNLDKRFNLFIRKRVKCNSEWRGYERKRGALIDLNSLILADKKTNFSVILGDNYKKKYIITLDSDTLLDCADDLVAIMEHPFNETATVVSLNMNTTPASHNETFFSRLMDGGVGLDGYSYPYRHLHSRVFGAGNFTGKGIYRVKEFYEKTVNAFPDERILSHDFIEGAFVGCKNCDLEALDNFPSTPQAYFTRALRWLRGDIQLIPYLFPIVKNKQGKWSKNPIGIINAYHIMMNINFALLPVALSILLFLSALSLSQSAILVVGYYAVKILFSLPTLLCNGKAFIKNIATLLYNLSLLPVVSIYNLAWILITLFRLIKNDKLLDWKVSAHGGKLDLAFPQIIYTVAFFTSNLFLGNSILCYGFCVFFITVLPLNILISEKQKSRKLSDKLQVTLEYIAQKTWRYFIDSHKVEYNFLPPDNFDEREDFSYALRTSPTDIGMSLVSCFCAYKLNLIGKEQASEYIHDTLLSVQKLEKWKGNLYNWYDIKTLAPLPPRFVSFVDSGNFLCSMLLIEELVGDIDKDLYNKIINETDLSTFYDEERGLAFNGYNDTEKHFVGHYDLVASESSITYLLAIALGHFPWKTWKNLSHRTYYYAGNTLASWTGGAFEYLLCPQFFNYQKGTLYFDSALSSVKGQIKYCSEKNLHAFGISESLFGAFEDNGDYKYKAFGVPNYALSNSGETTVLSPYSALLSLPFATASVEAVISYYISIGAVGKYGLFDAIDKTPVRVYMAHHQGMIMLSLLNALKDNCAVKTLASRPFIKATDLLLSRPKNQRRANSKPTVKRIEETADSVIFIGESKEINEYYLYEKRDYRMAIDGDGNGFSMYKNSTVNAKRRGTGMLVFAKTNDYDYSLTANSYSTFTNSHATFEKRTPSLFSIVKASVLSNGAGEVREVTVRNLTNSPLNITLTSYEELTLGNAEAQNSHREYYNMFVRTKFLPLKDAIKAEREGLFAVHYCSEKAEYNTSKRAFYNGDDSVKFGCVLDPIFSAQTTFTLFKNEQKTVRFFTLVSFDKNKLFSSLALTQTYEYYALLSSNSMLDGYASQIFSRIVGAVGSVKSDTEFSKNLPVVALKFNANHERNKTRLLAIETALRFGARFSLAVIYKEREGYFRKEREKIETMLSKCPLLNRIPVTIINEHTESKRASEVLKNAVDFNEENKRIDFAMTVKTKPRASEPLTSPKLKLQCGIGGFTDEGDYYIDLNKTVPPKPWSVVLSNGLFGTVITNNGGGYTFSENSRENKLTEWNNDASQDIPSESVLFCENSLCWSVAPSPVKTNGYYSILFSRDSVKHSCSFNAITTHLTQFVGFGKRKYYKVEIINQTNEIRSLSVALAVDIVLGSDITKTAHALSGKKEGNRLIMRNCASGEVATIDCSEKLNEYAFNRKTMQNSYGDCARLTHLDSEIKGTSLIYSVKVALSPKNKKTLVFTLSTEEESNLSKYDEILEEKSKRRGTLCPIFINSGYLPIDLLYKWLPTQTFDCRFNARSGFYQSGGAFGFRDQLQDCLAIMYFSPSRVREHILKCASRQFIEGDVLHWWHEERQGVRTHITDDRLFLPLVVSEYISFTGDDGILNERVNYLKSMPIPVNSPSLYTEFEVSERKGSIYEHCKKAIDSIVLNEKNLALMGGGDWNDGMDEVGNKGKGTSVFVTMLLYLVIKKFMPHFLSEEKHFYAKELVKLKTAVEGEWEEDRYHRATTDEGVVLGSKSSTECKIDLLTQAFAVLSEIADEERGKIALQTAYDLLFDKQNNLVKLLSPPFKNLKVGYISSYPEGIRENGGQYTHATVWFAMALIKAGETEKAWEVFKAVNPVNHSLTLSDTQKYKNEPFVLSADIYSGERAGEGGWSWYTGSAGWAFKLITEGFFGLMIRGKTLSVTPALPSEIKTAQVVIKRDGAVAKITIDNTEKEGEWTVKVDETTYSKPLLTLSPSLNGRTITVKRAKK